MVCARVTRAYAWESCFCINFALMIDNYHLRNLFVEDACDVYVAKETISQQHGRLEYAWKFEREECILQQSRYMEPDNRRLQEDCITPTAITMQEEGILGTIGILDFSV